MLSSQGCELITALIFEGNRSWVESSDGIERDSKRKTYRFWLRFHSDLGELTLTLHLSISLLSLQDQLGVKLLWVEDLWRL